MKTTLFSTLILLALVMLTGCGGGSSGNISMTPVGDEMRFEQTNFTVKPGQTVNIKFRNTATSQAMSHNVVFLNDDNDATVERVGQAAMAAGEAKQFIPDDAAILAFTPLAKPGQQVSVTFTAPTEPGTYRYICTFPGHYMMMQGVMTVTA